MSNEIFGKLFVNYFYFNCPKLMAENIPMSQLVKLALGLLSSKSRFHKSLDRIDLHPPCQICADIPI